MEKNTDSEPNSRDEESCHEEAVITKIEKSSSPEPGLLESSSAKNELTLHADDDHDQLESAKAEMDQLMEENQRLKMYLNQILKDYRSLQTQYHQDHVHDQRDTITTTPDDRHDEEPELIALSLGRTSSGSIKYEHHKTLSSSHRSSIKSDEDEKLTLGLNSKFEAPNKLLLQAADQQPNADPLNRAEETKRDEQDHRQMTFDPAQKNIHERDGLEDDEITQENPVKRARVSVRVRCDTPTMNDGCQWRKYGQKISKGNPCPRAYYRCTVAPSCPVRKQVQRCADDLSILTTTYEGTHNHPLPISATSMASTTSAAASMLVSGSSSSASSSITAALNGLNAYLPEHSRTASKPFNYLLNSSISTSTPYPTITLDLTSSPYASLPTTQRSFTSSRFSSATNLNFNTVESNPATWSNGGSTYSYGSSTITAHQHQPVIFNNKISQTPSSLSFGANPTHETSPYQSYLLKTDNIPNPNQQSLASPETIAAATKAITSDPNFQSALAAALSSIIGSSSAGNNNDLESQKVVGKSGHQSSGKSSDHHHQPRFPILSSFPPLMNSNKCTPSGFVKSSTSSSSAGSQPSSLMFLSPTFQLPNSKSKPNSPGDNRDRSV